MDFKPSFGVAPRGGSPEQVQEPRNKTSQSSNIRDGYTPPEIDQSHDIALVSKLLNRSHNCHGVCNEKILVWGLPGCGKRRIATQAALQFSANTGCKILWIEGRSFETFVRDYRNAYTTLTGQPLPQGLTTGSLLLKIMVTLESRRTEWLMVIFDLQYYLEDGGDTGPNSAPTSFLPDWCRILVTSSYVVASSDGSVDQDLSMICGLRFARKATCLHVVGFDERQTAQYVKESGLNSFDLGFPAFRHQSCTSIAPLRLALSCASMRFLGISASQFSQMCRRKFADSSSPSWPGSTPTFADTMSILWDALNNYDPAAGILLTICSAVDRLDIPIVLLHKFPIFREDDGERLSSVINILKLSGLLEVRRKFDLDTVNLHLLVYRWLQVSLRRIEDGQEYADLMTAWIAIFTEYLSVPKADQIKEGPIFSPDKFWPVAAHVASLCNLKPDQVRALCSVAYMTFLRHVAIFLVEDGILSNLAGVTITHAFNMCMLLHARGNDGVQLHREYVLIRQIRSAAYLKVSEFRQAENELREARLFFNHHLTRDTASQHMLRQIQDAEAHLHIIQGHYPEAGRLLTDILASPESNPDPFKIAQRHYWTAIYKTAVEADISALEHSHMTMTYWKTLAPEDQWGYKDSRRLHWVEKHVLSLMCMRKYKGALLLGRKLLERTFELTSVLGPSICRLTYRVAYCLCALDKVNEAESAVCQLLELSSYGRFEDETLSYLLHMLHELGIALQRNGRTVEAEGVYRFNLRTAKRFNVRNLAGTDKYDPTGDWIQLVMCFLEQGKTLEARRLRDEYQTEEVNEEFMDNTIRDALKAYRHMIYVYTRTIEAEKAGDVLEWKAILDTSTTRPALKRAIKMFGHPRRRIERDRDFESDIDIHNVGRARRSRILQLLNFPLIYLSFVNANSVHADPTENEELWANQKQSVLGQYWKWCDCRRKRNRSQSTDEFEQIMKHVIVKENAHPNQGRKKLQQKLITDWVIRKPGGTNSISEACNPSCPCIEANRNGQREALKLESNLLLWKESNDESSSKSKNRPRYRNSKPNRSPIPENEMFSLILPNNWWWVQSEFANGENEGENYIIPRAIDIPGISITPPDGQTDLLPMATDPQEKMTKFYQRDYAADFAKVLERQEREPMTPTALDVILEDDEDEE
ncbi:uncharacterized protein Z518_03891 [Rhinocladiella mackenziei CBS 650.93]|uniref:Uncharacterized protein n=1 Tax=Rhinocladiella mackenziei CBS 650.93 TaxID=1442369 RepID=A0A0D2FUZ5_9EURO|nr:uncharacterized protein Z518_03891 [Rhinocladiella mackenziei CBS 650.93]KIX05917.1 hypothetical protein Z518_03891 [Rhinocladiella mackenziei CBS 650.93]